MQYIQWVIDHYQGICAVGTAVIVLATAVTAVTPTEHDNAVLNKVLAFMQRFGFIAADADGNKRFSIPLLQGRKDPEAEKV